VDSADKLMLFVGSAIGFAALSAVVEKYWLRFGWLVIPVVLTIIVVVWGARDSAFKRWRRLRLREGEKGSRSKHIPATTEPEVEVPEARTDPDAVRHTDDPGIAAPGPATQNALLTACRPRRILGGATPIVLLVVPVVHPLPHVPEHVV
jgi:hypothetical protein